MTDDAIDQLERLLREERDAIKRLDGARVLAFAKQKEELVASLVADAGLDAGRKDRLRRLVPALRENGVLLAHARDIVRDALGAAGVVARSERAASTSARRLLSVRG